MEMNKEEFKKTFYDCCEKCFNECDSSKKVADMLYKYIIDNIDKEVNDYVKIMMDIVDNSDRVFSNEDYRTNGKIYNKNRKDIVLILDECLANDNGISIMDFVNDYTNLDIVDAVDINDVMNGIYGNHTLDEDCDSCVGEDIIVGLITFIANRFLDYIE